jgi:hypothetical protein
MHEFDSNMDQEAYLRAAQHAVSVGTDAECPRKYLAFDVATYSGDQVRVGVTLTDHGIKPSWITSNDRTMLVVGHDLRLSFVSLKEYCIVTVQRLEGVFYEFILEAHNQSFIVLHELGVSRFDFNGTELWSVSTPDIAESARLVDGQTLIVQHQGPGRTMAVDILTARISSPSTPRH